MCMNVSESTRCRLVYTVRVYTVRVYTETNEQEKKPMQ